MNESRTTLQDLRGEIDGIDAKLHGLIKRRAALVEQIRTVKSRDAIATVRPGREADILRTLAAHHDGDFPFAAVARIWREIIAGITRMEMPDYSVAVYSTTADQGYWDLARNAFGSSTPMTAFASSREVLGEVSARGTTLGVLPWPREGDADPWWINLAVQDGLRVSYRLPFTPNYEPPNGGSRAEALAVGHVAPEASGRDRSLIVIETRDALSRAGLAGLLEKAQIDGRPIASHQNGACFHLVEADGFLTDADPGLDELSRLVAVDRTIVIGAYATRIDAASMRSGAP